MTEATELGDSSRIALLESEVRAMRKQVELRDELLRVLNQRLLELERGELSAAERKEIGATPRADESVRGIVRSVLNTKMFRWTRPARRLRGKLHRRRHGPV